MDIHAVLPNWEGCVAHPLSGCFIMKRRLPSTITTGGATGVSAVSPSRGRAINTVRWTGTPTA